MDAPNAPNPANPNVQDQNADMRMQCKVLQIRLRVPWYKIRLRVPQLKTPAQGPAVQIPVQVPAGQIPAQVPAAQVPVQGPMQVGQNIPAQPLQQPVPIQLAPAGIVVPTPQIIYQNWIGKKPEFSGKPEEDAESLLLSTRDWMEAHSFPEGEKVR